VNFNRNSRGSWLPPELGKTKNIARYNIHPRDWDAMGINNSKGFLKSWDTIHSIRNSAAHTDQVTLNDYNLMKSALIDIAQSQVLEKMSVLKNSFKGTVNGRAQ
jgi:hypothetical protein